MNENDVDTTDFKPGEEELLTFAAEKTMQLVVEGLLPPEGILIVGLLVADLSEYVGKNFVWHGLDVA